MAIPDFQSIMLPLLKFAGDEQEHRIPDAVGQLAEEFNLTDENRLERLASGQGTFRNRVAWAKVHLQVARLLESSQREWFRITDRGRSLLKEEPDRITCRFLRQYEEYEQQYGSRHKKHSGKDNSQSDQQDAAKTPEEALQSGFAELRDALAVELLQIIKSMSPAFFERLVVDLLIKMGYGGSRRDAGQAIGGSGDGGIDGVIKEDKLGLDVIYVQAKRWENTVGRPVVQAFAGSLEGVRARRGILITTSAFSREARDYVSNIEKKIVLIDGEKLADLMIDHNVGVSTLTSYEIKKIDTDFFTDE